MLVNRGGDPERDDYGLPPVNIEIPDDARELDRDIQAYHRELRMQRRNRLVRRLGGPLTRDGMVLPLLASCLALTLLAGTLLTMFTARRAVPSTLQTTSAPQRITAPGGPGGRPAAGRQRHGRQRSDPRTARLPPCGPRARPGRLRMCGRGAAAERSRRAPAGVMLYFVAAGPAVAQARKLARQGGLGDDRVVTDT